MWSYQDLSTLSKNLAVDFLKVELQLAKLKTKLKLDSYSNYDNASDLPLDHFSPDQVQCLLLLAAYRGDHSTVEALVTKSIGGTGSKRICQMNALHLALIKGHVDCVTAILAPGELRAGWLKTSLHQQYSPLHLAVYFEHFPCLEAILASASDRMDVIDFMHKTNPQCTPLHIAVMLDSVEAAELLLRFGADIDGRPVIYTPLHLAAQYENCEMTHWLLEHGADWKINTPEGISALALVENHVPEAMTAYLDSCILLNDPKTRGCESVIVNVDTSKLTSRPNQITGSLLSDFKELGYTSRLEHPTCQIMISSVTDKVVLFHFLYLFYVMVGIVLSLYFIMSTYGCICIQNTNKMM